MVAALVGCRLGSGPSRLEGRLLPYSTGQRTPACFYTSYRVYLPAAGTPSYALASAQPGSIMRIVITGHAESTPVHAYSTDQENSGLFILVSYRRLPG